MNIGIISINLYPRSLNFACPIHSFAFQRFLKKNGIDSTIIDYKPSYDYAFDLEHPSDFYKKEMDKLTKKKTRTEAEEKRLVDLEKNYKAYRNIYKEREGRYQKARAFTNKYYKKTDKVYNSDLMETEELDFDCYICATDVIWKTCSIKKWGFERAYFLASHAMDNKHKLAYAGSRNAKLKKTEQDLFFHYLSDFDAITVREESLKTLLAEKGKIDSELVLDPVMLLEKKDYEEIAVAPKDEKYLLLYYVVRDAEDTIAQAVAYAREHNLKIIEISDKTSSTLAKMNLTDVEYSWRYDVGPDEWLGYFMNAECVFTNSFHATCFSILFEKELFVGARNGDKVSNVLGMFDMLHRQFAADRDLIHDPLAPIDYEKVGTLLEQRRSESAGYILEAIRKAENTEPRVRDYDTFRKQLEYEFIYKWEVPAKDAKSAPIVNRFSGIIKNDESHHLVGLCMDKAGYKLAGWKLRFLIDNMWFWYLEDGTFKWNKEYKRGVDAPLKLFKVGDTVPYFPFNKIAQVAVEAVWEQSK